MCLGAGTVAPAGVQDAGKAFQDTRYLDELLREIQGSPKECGNFKESALADVANLGGARGVEGPAGEDAHGVEVQETGRDSSRAIRQGEALESHVLDKTRLCKFFSKGLCRRGDSCTFAHGKRQLRGQPDLYRTQMCFHFGSTGGCSFGDKCKYAHSSEEVRPASMQKPVKQREAKKTETSACRAPRDKVASVDAEALALELEKVQQEAMRLKAQLQALQQTAPCTSPARQVSDGSTIVTSQGRPSCGSFSGDSSDAGDMWGADSSQGDGGSAASPRSGEAEIEVTLAVRNTFLDLVPVCPGAWQRAKSAPPATRSATS